MMRGLITTRQRKLAFIVTILCMALAGGREYCLAVEGGARPISMGGAFIALSDDVNATTWNPAGLAWQQEKEFSVSAIVTHRTDYISADFVADDYVVYAQPVRAKRTSDAQASSGFGFYYKNASYENETTRAKTSIWQPGLAYGRQVTNYENMAWGLSLNYYYFDSTLPSGSSDNDAAISLNGGYLWYINDDLVFGLMVENVNEPTYAVHGVKNRLVRVARPGLAYFFADSTVATLEIYDITGNTEDRGADLSQDIRIGFEHYINDHVSLRLGAHHLNSDFDASKFYSFGIGWQRSDFFQIYPVCYYFDYTLISWPDAPAGMEDLTHLLGLTVKF